MNGKKVISILTVLFLLSLMTCPLMAYPLSKSATHDCSEKNKNNDQKQHFCCDQQAITAKAAFEKSADSATIIAQFPLVSSLKPNFLDNLETSFFGPPASKDLLTKLTILRI
jgi:hypothetical protein